MKKGLKKAAVFGLSACLAMTSLAGCSKKDTFDETAAAITVNGTEVSAGVVKFMTHYMQAATESFYNAYFGSNAMNQAIDEAGTTLGGMMKEENISSLKEMVLAEQKMEEYGVSLTDEEKAAITEAATSFIESNGEEVLEKMGATQETVERYLELVTIQTKMEPAMSADVDTEVSDEEAAQRRIQYTLFTAQTESETEASTEGGSEAVTEAGSEASTEAASEAGTEAATEAVSEAAETEAETAVLTENETTKTQAAAETETETVTEAGSEASTEAADATEASTEAGTEDASEPATEEETETEDPAMVAAKEEAYAKAMEAIEKIKAGEDFEAAVQSVDPDLSAHEMTFGADDTTVAEGLLTATEGVADDTLIEEPVETSTGYYVVKLVTQLDREATDAEKEDIVEERKRDRIAELYEQWEEEAEITTNDELLAQIVFDFSLTLETEAATEAETESVTEAGSEAATEAATEAGSEAATEAATEIGSEAATEAATENTGEAETEAATEAGSEAATEAVTE